MGATVLWEKIKPGVLAEMDARGNWLAALAERMKTAIAEIAATKSFQRLGREEEKE
jgi:hypothetical protein